MIRCGITSNASKILSPHTRRKLLGKTAIVYHYEFQKIKQIKFGTATIKAAVPYLLFKLKRSGVEAVISSALCNKLIMTAALNDATVVKHHYNIGIHDR